MKTLVQILVISDDDTFVKHLLEVTDHPQVTVDSAQMVPEKGSYDFYVLGNNHITKSLDRIRKFDTGTPVYLHGSVCSASIPICTILKSNVVACLQNKDDLRGFAKEISSCCRQKLKIHEASRKLDHLKSGDLEALTRQLRKTESNKFVDYIQNHPLPMVLVNRESEVMHANAAMEDMIGMKLPGILASAFWEDKDAFDDTIYDLKEKGQLLGREVTLKNIHGKSLRLKLYTSLHRNADGDWLNTRCLLVPIDQSPE